MSSKKDHVHAVETARDWIIQFFSDHPVLVHHTLRHVSEVTRQGIGVQLRLDEENYANSFIIWDEEKETVTSGITMVESSMGHSIGFFLFHLQLVLAILSGATEITIDNDTNDPARARRGIYQLFKTNVRNMDAQERARWRALSEENQMRKPEMVHMVRKGSLAQIHKVLTKRLREQRDRNVAGKEEIWRENVEEVLALFFRSVRKAFDLYSGGRRTEKAKRAKTKKRQTRRRY